MLILRTVVDEQITRYRY